jgi:hypothetical protein
VQINRWNIDYAGSQAHEHVPNMLDGFGACWMSSELAEQRFQHPSGVAYSTAQSKSTYIDYNDGHEKHSFPLL